MDEMTRADQANDRKKLDSLSCTTKKMNSLTTFSLSPFFFSSPDPRPSVPPTYTQTHTITHTPNSHAHRRSDSLS